MTLNESDRKFIYGMTYNIIMGFGVVVFLSLGSQSLFINKPIQGLYFYIVMVLFLLFMCRINKKAI